MKYLINLKTFSRRIVSTALSPINAFLLFGACSTTRTSNESFLDKWYLKYIIAELKPSSSEIIQQGIDNGDIQFDYPDELAEIVLIILAVKFDNTLAPSTPEEIEKTIRALISLLEKGTENPIGSLDFLRAF